MYDVKKIRIVITVAILFALLVTNIQVVVATEILVDSSSSSNQELQILEIDRSREVKDNELTSTTLLKNGEHEIPSKVTNTNNEKDPEHSERNQLIVNGDFSEIESKSGRWTNDKPKAWGLWIPGDIKTKDYTAEINKEKQLVISSLKDEYRSAVNQKIDIDSSKTYELSFDIKTVDLSNIARVRINEQNETGQTNLWYSRSLKGTNDWQKIVQNFEPNARTSFITVELFFEKGTGTLYFDNLSLVEKSISEENEIKLEDKIEIHEKNIYFQKQADFDYRVSDSTIIKNEKGVLYPISVGETEIKIFDNQGNFIKEIPLIVNSFEENKYDKMLNQWNEVIAGNDYFSKNNEVMVQQNNKLDDAVSSILSVYTYNENPKTLWSDISDFKNSADLTTSFQRIETIAKQISQPESKYYQNPEVIRVVRNALEWLNERKYNENVSINGNWWDYEIGVPRAMNNSLSLLRRYFTEEEILKYTRATNYFVPDSYYFRVTLGTPFKALGGNLIDMGRVKIISGALQQNDDIVIKAIESLQQAFNYTTFGESGFFEDGSYIDHDNVALTGAYGSVLIDGLSQLLPVVLESGMLPEDKLNTLYQFIDDSFLPLMYKGEIMDMTRGRAISRQKLQSHAAGGEVIRGIMRIAASSGETQRNRLNTIIKTLIKENNYYDIYQSLSSYKDIDLMDNLLNDRSIETIKFSTKLSVFNNMDKLAYQNTGANFALGISMFSNKTQNYEYMNQENARGWYISDGAVYLYNDDLSHYNDNYWATVNPYHVPGTTIIPGEREVGSGMGTLPSSYVGGTKLDDSTASVVMDFTNWNQTLTAKKSWFIFNDKIVFLGSDIQVTGDTPAYTTIENRKNNKVTNYEIFINGVKKQLEQNHMQLNDVNTLLLASPTSTSMNIGYLFLEETSLDYANTVEQGSWQAVNATQSNEMFENNFLTFYQTHKDEKTSYAYILYPNISNEQLLENKSESKINVLQNDAAVQAVYDKEEKSWGIVLYEDQTFKLNEYISINKRGVYSIKEEKDRYILSYYNPADEKYYENIFTTQLRQEVGKQPSNKDKSTIIYLYFDTNVSEAVSE